MSLVLLREAVRMMAAGLPDGGVQGGPSTTIEEDPMDEKRAACVLVRRAGCVLAVSRKDDPTAMGLPGGKLDPADWCIAREIGLDPAAVAASRELFEETGLHVSVFDLRRVFERGPDEDDGYITTTFEVDWADCSGTIHTKEAGRVRWVDWAELLMGPFGRYNRVLMQTLGI